MQAIVPLLVSILMMQVLLSITHNVSAAPSSPSFVRQEILAAPNDWALWKEPSQSTLIRTHSGHSIQVENANDISQCKVGEKFVSPSIESVSYISNGKTLNATVWLNNPYRDPPLKDTIDIYHPKQFEMKVSELPQRYSHMSVDKYATLRVAEDLLDPSKNVTIDEQSNSSTIGGNHAYSIVYTSKDSEGINLKNMTLWTIKNTKAYEFTYSAVLMNYSYYLPAIKSMLNSFKFENPASSDQNTNNREYAKQDSDVSISRNTTEFKALGIKIDYPADWKIQVEKAADSSTGDVIFRSPFQDELFESPSWHETTFTMAIAIGSAQHPSVTDYRVILSRNPTNANETAWAWTRKVVEVSAYDKERVLEEEKNYTAFYQQGQPYILFSFDLAKINFPQQFNAVFYTTDYFVEMHRFCRLIDITNWVNIPPPEFLMSTTPTSVILRPGQQKDIELTIKGNTNLASQVYLTESNTNNNNTNDNNGVSISFIPNKLYLPPSNVGTSILHVKVSSNAKPVVYNVPILANISFPNTITNRGGETFSNSKSQSISQRSNVTLSLLPAFTPEEQLSSFVSTWVTPITGIWTFLAGVGVVIAPLIINMYRKKKSKSGK